MGLVLFRIVMSHAVKGYQWFLEPEDQWSRVSLILIANNHLHNAGT